MTTLITAAPFRLGRPANPAIQWPSVSPVWALLAGGSALFVAAVACWAVLMSLDAITPTSWSVLGTLACLGAAAIPGETPDLVRQIARQGDGVAAMRNTAGHQKRLTDSTQTQLDSKGQRRQDDRGIQQAISQLVGDIGPGRLKMELRLDSFLRKPAEFVGDNGGRGIGEPKKSNSQRGFGAAAAQRDDFAHDLLSRRGFSCSATNSATI